MLLDSKLDGSEWSGKLHSHYYLAGIGATCSPKTRQRCSQTSV